MQEQEEDRYSTTKKAKLVSYGMRRLVIVMRSLSSVLEKADKNYVRSVSSKAQKASKTKALERSVDLTKHDVEKH